MIILDTNVLSALMLREPHLEVASWMDRQAPSSVWTTAITVFEILSGLGAMPSGRRRTARERSFELLLEEKLENRVLSFDSTAAEEAATLMASRRRMGRVGDLRDTMIAGIALAQRATLATRNVQHFNDLNVAIIDPWNPQSFPVPAS